MRWRWARMGNTLYVAETGGETIDMIDLNAVQQPVARILAPPIPRAANTAIVSVTAMAVGFSGLQYLASNGNLWEVIANTAAPRQGTFVTGVNATTGAQTAIPAPGQTMVSSADGSKMLLLGGNATSYLYDALTDTYTSENPLFSGTVTGFYGPLAIGPNNAYMLANGMVLNSSLSVIGGASGPNVTPVTPPAQPGQPANSVAQSPLRNVAAVTPLDQTSFARMTTPVRASITATTTDDVHTTIERVDTRTGATQVVAEMPENPIFSLFGNTRTNIPARQMAVDASGTVYALTLSGLSVAPITTTTAATAPGATLTRPVVNANNGSTTFLAGIVHRDQRRESGVGGDGRFFARPHGVGRFVRAVQRHGDPPDFDFAHTDRRAIAGHHPARLQRDADSIAQQRAALQAPAGNDR